MIIQKIRTKNNPSICPNFAKYWWVNCRVYDDINKVIDASKNYGILMRDFGAKAVRIKWGEFGVRIFGTQKRNERGKMLVQFSQRHKMTIRNTFFYKSEKTLNELGKA